MSDSRVSDRPAEPTTDPVTGAVAPARHRVVVAGHGMAGHRFVEDLLAHAGDAALHVTVLAEEARPAYDRVGLSAFFAGKSAEEMSLVADGFLDDERVELRLGDPVVGIDPAGRSVTTGSGRTVAYDTLVLATGSVPFVPPVPGRDADGVFVYRTLDDLERIRSHARGARRGAVIGGGLLGLEAADALRNLGVAEVHVVELAPRLMAAQLDEGGGAMLRRHIEELGVHVHVDTATRQLHADPTGTVRALEFADGTTLDVDLVVFSAGIRPRDALAREAGLAVGERGGIVVDDTCRTSDPAIVAVGECALARGRIWGLVAPCYAMAQVAARHVAAAAAGEPAPEAVVFAEADMSTKLKLAGVDVASVGDAHGTTAGALDLVWNDPTAKVYKKLVVSDDGRQVLGAVLVGDAEAYSLLKTLAAARAELPGAPEAVLFPDAGAGGAVAGPAALPPSATICSCNDVPKGVIVDSVVEHGCTDLPAVKACTKAGTSCGSCVPLVTKIMQGELERLGVSVDRSLCEHFRYTRRELFDLVRVNGHRTFTDVVTAHGTGRGCDICKPAVASILATQAPAHVLDGENAAIQDTNDHVMANLQKNGTYSVVPRMPGGEVTPDGLIAIGEVARDFGLYTKLTGGQRIDMFGARLEQLPLIWKRLVDAGFESGHAYGKSLRTVKSCVGVDWCRYGVQDSTGMAVALELRYRGLRSPHKLKSAVSGCARECAEAQSKDFGVIATEAGWNLYVGGNGGMRPRHADLLAKDVSGEDLVRYIDRYLMFYVRTADRLQRTSVWLESLEDPDTGLRGVDYLHHVVVADALGLGAELEADMARHVGSYHDEWAATLADPEKLKRFRSFVNAPTTADPSVRFALERGQIRPATPEEIAEGRVLVP